MAQVLHFFHSRVAANLRVIITASDDPATAHGAGESTSAQADDMDVRSATTAEAAVASGILASNTTQSSLMQLFRLFPAISHATTCIVCTPWSDPALRSVARVHLASAITDSTPSRAIDTVARVYEHTDLPRMLSSSLAGGELSAETLDAMAPLHTGLPTLEAALSVRDTLMRLHKDALAAHGDVQSALLGKVPSLSSAAEIRRRIISRVAGLTAHMHRVAEVEAKATFSPEAAEAGIIPVAVLPATFIHFLTGFRRLLLTRGEEARAKRERYLKGIAQLEATAASVTAMSQQLQNMKPMLAQNARDTEAMMAQVDAETRDVEKMRALVSKEEAEAEAKAAAAQALKEECEADLAKAMPAMDRALAAVRALRKADITEVKSMSNPPNGVRVVMQVVCMMMGVPPQKIPDPLPNNPGHTKSDYWQPAQRYLLGDVNFIQSLVDYKTDEIPQKIVDSIEPITKSTGFTKEVLSKASVAADNIGEWVKAVIEYHYALKVVRPKRIRLKEAEEEYQRLMRSLRAKQEELRALEARLDALAARLREMQARKAQLEASVATANAKLQRARAVMKGLGGEAKRWAVEAARIEAGRQCILGNMLLSAGYVTYLGGFNPDARNRIMAAWTSAVDAVGIGRSGATPPGGALMLRKPFKSLQLNPADAADSVAGISSTLAGDEQEDRTNTNMTQSTVDAGGVGMEVDVFGLADGGVMDTFTVDAAGADVDQGSTSRLSGNAAAAGNVQLDDAASVESESSASSTRTHSTFTLSAALGDSVQLRAWQLAGLPPDALSVDNGLIIINTKRWPLIVDPGKQAVAWIRAVERETGLVTSHINAPDITTRIKGCLEEGNPLLLVLGSSTSPSGGGAKGGLALPPWMDNILTMQKYVKDGKRFVKFRDELVPYNSGFRLYLVTAESRPIIPSALQTKVTTVLFSPTWRGVSQQLLNTAMARLHPALEDERIRLVVAAAANRAQLRSIEDKILRLLATASAEDEKAEARGDGNDAAAADLRMSTLLEDGTAVETLTKSQELAASLQAKQTGTIRLAAAIGAVRRVYGLVAAVGSVCYFSANQLQAISRMYAYGLGWFRDMFENSVTGLPPVVAVDTMLEHYDTVFGDDDDAEQEGKDGEALRARGLSAVGDEFAPPVAADGTLSDSDPRMVAIRQGHALFAHHVLSDSTGVAQRLSDVCEGIITATLRQVSLGSHSPHHHVFAWTLMTQLLQLTSQTSTALPALAPAIPRALQRPDLPPAQVQHILQPNAVQALALLHQMMGRVWRAVITGSSRSASSAAATSDTSAASDGGLKRMDSMRAASQYLQSGEGGDKQHSSSFRSVSGGSGKGPSVSAQPLDADVQALLSTYKPVLRISRPAWIPTGAWKTVGALSRVGVTTLVRVARLFCFMREQQLMLDPNVEMTASHLPAMLFTVAVAARSLATLPVTLQGSDVAVPFRMQAVPGTVPKDATDAGRTPTVPEQLLLPLVTSATAAQCEGTLNAASAAGSVSEHRRAASGNARVPATVAFAGTLRGHADMWKQFAHDPECAAEGMFVPAGDWLHLLLAGSAVGATGSVLHGSSMTVLDHVAGAAVVPMIPTDEDAAGDASSLVFSAAVDSAGRDAPPAMPQDSAAAAAAGAASTASLRSVASAARMQASGSATGVGTSQPASVFDEAQSAPKLSAEDGTYLATLPVMSMLLRLALVRSLAPHALMRGLNTFVVHSTLMVQGEEGAPAPPEGGAAGADSDEEDGATNVFLRTKKRGNVPAWRRSDRATGRKAGMLGHHRRTSTAQSFLGAVGGARDPAEDWDPTEALGELLGQLETNIAAVDMAGVGVLRSPVSMALRSSYSPHVPLVVLQPSAYAAAAVEDDGALPGITLPHPLQRLRTGGSHQSTTAVHAASGLMQATAAAALLPVDPSEVRDPVPSITALGAALDIKVHVTGGAHVSAATLASTLSHAMRAGGWVVVHSLHEMPTAGNILAHVVEELHQRSLAMEDEEDADMAPRPAHSSLSDATSRAAAKGSGSGMVPLRPDARFRLWLLVQEDRDELNIAPSVLTAAVSVAADCDLDAYRAPNLSRELHAAATNAGLAMGERASAATLPAGAAGTPAAAALSLGGLASPVQSLADSSMLPGEAAATPTHRPTLSSMSHSARRSHRRMSSMGEVEAAMAAAVPPDAAEQLLLNSPLQYAPRRGQGWFHAGSLGWPTWRRVIAVYMSSSSPMFDPAATGAMTPPALAHLSPRLAELTEAFQAWVGNHYVSPSAEALNAVAAAGGEIAVHDCPPEVAPMGEPEGDSDTEESAMPPQTRRARKRNAALAAAGPAGDLKQAAPAVPGSAGVSSRGKGGVSEELPPSRTPPADIVLEAAADTSPLGGYRRVLFGLSVFHSVAIMRWAVSQQAADAPSTKVGSEDATTSHDGIGDLPRAVGTDDKPLACPFTAPRIAAAMRLLHDYAEAAAAAAAAVHGVGACPPDYLERSPVHVLPKAPPTPQVIPEEQEDVSEAAAPSTPGRGGAVSAGGKSADSAPTQAEKTPAQATKPLPDTVTRISPRTNGLLALPGFDLMAFVRAVVHGVYRGGAQGQEGESLAALLMRCIEAACDPSADARPLIAEDYILAASTNARVPLPLSAHALGWHGTRLVLDSNGDSEPRDALSAHRLSLLHHCVLRSAWPQPLPHVVTFLAVNSSYNDRANPHLMALPALGEGTSKVNGASIISTRAGISGLPLSCVQYMSAVPLLAPPSVRGSGTRSARLLAAVAKFVASRDGGTLTVEQKEDVGVNWAVVKRAADRQLVRFIAFQLMPEHGPASAAAALADMHAAGVSAGTAVGAARYAAATMMTAVQAMAPGGGLLSNGGGLSDMTPGGVSRGGSRGGGVATAAALRRVMSGISQSDEVLGGGTGVSGQGPLEPEDVADLEEIEGGDLAGLSSAISKSSLSSAGGALARQVLSLAPGKTLTPHAALHNHSLLALARIAASVARLVPAPFDLAGVARSHPIGVDGAARRPAGTLRSSRRYPAGHLTASPPGKATPAPATATGAAAGGSAPKKRPAKARTAHPHTSVLDSNTLHSILHKELSAYNAVIGCVSRHVMLLSGALTGRLPVHGAVARSLHALACNHIPAEWRVLAPPALTHAVAGVAAGGSGGVAGGAADLDWASSSFEADMGWQAVLQGRYHDAGPENAAWGVLGGELRVFLQYLTAGAAFFRSWVKSGTPSVLWLPAFFDPSALVTAVVNEAARWHGASPSSVAVRGVLCPDIQPAHSPSSVSQAALVDAHDRVSAVRGGSAVLNAGTPPDVDMLVSWAGVPAPSELFVAPAAAAAEAPPAKAESRSPTPPTDGIAMPAVDTGADDPTAAAARELALAAVSGGTFAAAAGNTPSARAGRPPAARGAGGAPSLRSVASALRQSSAALIRANSSSSGLGEEVHSADGERVIVLRYAHPGAEFAHVTPPAPPSADGEAADTSYYAVSPGAHGLFLSGLHLTGTARWDSALRALVVPGWSGPENCSSQPLPPAAAPCPVLWLQPMVGAGGDACAVLPTAPGDGVAHTPVAVPPLPYSLPPATAPGVLPGHAPTWLRVPILVHSNAPAASAVSILSLTGSAAPRQNAGAAEPCVPGMHRSVRMLTLHVPAVLPAAKPQDGDRGTTVMQRPPVVPAELEHPTGAPQPEALDVSIGDIASEISDLPAGLSLDPPLTEEEEATGVLARPVPPAAAALVRSVAFARQQAGTPVLLPAGPVLISTLPPV